MDVRKSIPSFFLFILLIILIEWIGHVFTMSSVKDWYLTLQKTSWNPPAYVFGPVWTILYVMIAIAGWRVYVIAPSSKQKRQAFVFYGLQLACNLFWSFFFFFLRSPLLGLIDIVAILIFLILNIRAFYRLDRVAAILLIPYLLWTFYAAILNFTLWSLNGQLAQSRPFRAESSELSVRRGKELAARFRSGESPLFTEEFFN